jgi:hypothetical protein
VEDIMGKLSELLSDEESVRQLAELAQMLMSDSSGGGEKEGEVAGEGENREDTGIPDLGALLKLTGLFGSLSQNDRNAELLLALKPHLSEERQKKVDKAIKLLKLIAVWNMAKESGLLNELF